MQVVEKKEITTTVSKHNAQLKKSLSKWDLLTIGVGAAVGWSWVMYAGVWTSVPGSMGGIIAFLIGGILCSFVGLAYAELASAMPRAGGDIVYTFKGLGDRWAFFAGACVGYGLLTLIVVETIMLPIILGALGFPLPKIGALYSIGGETIYASYVIVSILFNFFFAFLNMKGVEFSKVFQTITVAVMLLAAVFYVIVGVSLGDIDNAKPLVSSLSGISLTLLMVPGFLAGFNVVAQAAEETNVKPKMIGRLVVITVWASAAFYILIIIGTGFSANLEMRQTAQIVVLDSLVQLLHGSQTAKIFVAIAALIGMLTSWNAAYLAGSRVLFALGRAKYISKGFSELHRINKTPAKAVMFLFILSSLGAFLGTSKSIFMNIVNVSGFMMVCSWLLVVITFMVLRKKEPNLNRPYRVAYGGAVGWLAILSLVFFLFLYTPLNPLGGLSVPELVVLSILLLTILALYFINVQRSNISREEREKFLFDNGD
ncbi:APC family permease [Neobacillus citreus]|uniref:APC family permease n=1 Tax=Neobacillus citreus TaxID=2833578 RepID=A0A942YBI7_9BACI|nr:APC family permease [Neobacillus citreus]MCH6264322.1 APC family permease [Neobacillus citreus]